MISLKQNKTESDSCDLSTALGEKENKYQKWMGELQNVQGWKRLPEVILSNDRSPRKMFIFSWLLKISKENPPPWQLNPVPHHLHKIFPDIQAHISCSSVSDRCLLSWLLVPIKWAWLHLVILSYYPFTYLNTYWWNHSQPPLPQAEQSLISQSFLIGEVFPAIILLICLTRSSHTCLALGSPELGTVLQARPHQYWEKKKGDFLLPKPSFSSANHYGSLE